MTVLPSSSSLKLSILYIHTHLIIIFLGGGVITKGGNEDFYVNNFFTTKLIFFFSPCSCKMCPVNTFSAPHATECSMCNEVTEYAGMLFIIIPCYFGDMEQLFRSVLVSWFVG